MNAEHTLKIDWTACAGRGLCSDLLPELIEADPWGYPLPRPEASNSRPTGEAGARPAPGTLAVVPAQLESPARRAVHLCPKLALRLTGSGNVH